MSQKINLNAYTKSLSCENISPATYLNEDVYTIEAFKIPESEWSKAQQDLKKLFDGVYQGFIKSREKTISEIVAKAKKRIEKNTPDSELQKKISDSIQLVDKQKAWKEFIAIVTGESKEKGAHIMTVDFKTLTKSLEYSFFQKVLLAFIGNIMLWFKDYQGNSNSMIHDLKKYMKNEGKSSSNQYTDSSGKKNTFFKVKYRNPGKQILHTLTNHHWNTNAEMILIPEFKISKA